MKRTFARSPLAGITDDIVPFGERQFWMARLQELTPHREARRRAVRVRYMEFEPEHVGPYVDTQISSGGVVVSGVDAGTAADPEATPGDDALNVADRLVAGVDTALELIGVEVLGGLGLPLTGALMGILTTLSGILVADKRHAEASKAVGILCAFFAIKQASLEETQPLVMTVEDVEKRAEGDARLRRIVSAQDLYRGPTPPSVLDDARDEGIRMVLDVLDRELRDVARRAARAHENMLVRVRVEYPGDEGVEARARAAYSLPWWEKEVRRAVYRELSASLEKPALAVFVRLSPK